MDYELLVAALAFIIPMCFSPGPNNVLCAAHGSRFGFKATLPLISGMAIGWSTLGILIGFSTEFISENESIFNFLTYISASYIAFLGYQIINSKSNEEANDDQERLGPATGIIIQVFNGKAWVHFLVLMVSFGSLFGSGPSAIVALVLLNLLFGLPAVMSWAAFGHVLKRVFDTPEQSKILNLVMGFALIGVAIWILVPKL